MIPQYISQKPLQLDNLFGPEEFFIIRFKKIATVFRIVNIRKFAFYFRGIQKIKEQLGVVVVLLSSNGIQVNNVFKQPVLRLGRNHLAQAAVRTMNQQSSKAAYF